MKPFEGKETYTTVDEWYPYKNIPCKNVHVLAMLDEKFHQKIKRRCMGNSVHPIIWWQGINGSNGIVVAKNLSTSYLITL